MIVSMILALSGSIDVIVPASGGQSSTAKPNSLKNIIIHKRTSYFIDIEAPVDQVWVGCNKAGPNKDSNSGMMFYALDGHTAYEFHYRRVYDVPMCLETEREYRRLMQGVTSVRFVGIHPREEPYDSQLTDERMPRRFTAAAKTISQVFVRMQAGNRCQAYFPEDCKLPKNYWGGTVPEPSIK